MRAVILALLAACSARVIDLGVPADAPHDVATTTACVCRVPCASAGTPCTATLGACGSDGYCTTSVGACTATTPTPCNSTYPTSKCLRPTTTSTGTCP